ncbi:Verru_Chthon cassette protein C [Prosthecobacter debontii]|uniref:Verru_Chthon cassette protein C n=1 Tax=Prosthecobacter debontii TaxID=48467 RepID=A0A1T4WVN7_9BACT|nr:Verru_Chthon cassette protein C [Prosthecobacter debontii]SKA80691.1 Verru_Chthon cassette protein C [Prosthecobacter debontii]
MKHCYKTNGKQNLFQRSAFTLVEIMVSMTVLVVLLLISAQVIGTVQSTWTASSARVGQFREARIAFDIITRNLSQATLNAYIDYDQSYLTATTNAGSGAVAPSKYLRKSDLRFVSDLASTLVPNAGSASIAPGHAVFFQAPLGIAHDPQYVGLDRLLCGRGYFVQYTSDDFFRPSILPPGVPRYRYRLMEFSPPAEKNTVYDDDKNKWIKDAGIQIEDQEVPTNRGLTRPIADNIVGMAILPMIEANAQGRSSGAIFEPQLSYDSLLGATASSQGNQHRLPPLVKVILVAIDERSADRLSQMGDGSTPPFGTDISDALTGSTMSTDVNAALEEVAEALRKKRVNYRVFSATVALRGAKWSS